MTSRIKHLNLDREPNEYYATDPIAINVLAKHTELQKDVWENAVGGEHLSKRLEQLGHTVRKSDIINRTGSEDIELINMLDYDGVYTGDIVTNPPYKCVLDFIRKSIDSVTVGSKVCMLLRIQFYEGISRHQFLKDNPPKMMLAFSRRLATAKGGAFELYNRKSNPSFFQCWFVWEKGFKGDTIIKSVYKSKEEL